MPKKTKTTQKSVFDPTTMGVFKGFQPLIGQLLGQYAKDPLTSSFANLRLQQMLGPIQALGGRQTQNLMQNALVGGFGGANMPAFMQSQLARIGRGQSGLMSQANIQNILGSEQLRQWATNAMLGYRPLQTGQEQFSKEYGLGTWLPQVAGMALGAATGGLGFGAMGGLGGLFGGGGAGGLGGFMGQGGFGGVGTMNPFTGFTGGFGQWSPGNLMPPRPGG